MEIVDHFIQNNFTSGRGGYMIKRIILHTYDGGGRSLYNWFNNPSTKASAHYAVFKDGGIERYVGDQDVAWSAGTYATAEHPNNNWESISIEHQDDNNPWDSVRTTELYESSAQLVALKCKEFGIPCRLLDSNQLWESGISLHRYYVQKSCPAGLDCNRIVARANEILNTGQPNNPPTNNPPLFMLVLNGWGLSNVAQAAGLVDNENTYEQIYNLNKGFRGAWDWRSLNARLQTGDVLRVRSDAAYPVPQEPPVTPPTSNIIDVVRKLIESLINSKP